MMLALLIALNVLPPLAVDTPPPPKSEQLATARSMSDILGLSRRSNGSRLPNDVVMPLLTNRSQINDYMRENYPAELRMETSANARAWLWMYVDENGFVSRPTIIQSSGRTSI